jgi:hypothetical protein
MMPRECLVFFYCFNYVCLIWSLLPADWQELAQNSEDTFEGLCVKTRADMRILGSLFLMWEVVPSF